MRISHTVDYGIRAAVALAVLRAEGTASSMTSRELSTQLDLPPRFFDDVLRKLRSGGITRSVRGSNGGWTLARSADQITVADVIRVLDGPLASVRGVRPHEMADDGQDEPMVSLWVATRAALRSVLERVTLADLARGELPTEVQSWANDAASWETRQLRASSN